MDFWYARTEEKIEEHKYLIMLDLKQEILKKLVTRDYVVNKFMIDELIEIRNFADLLQKRKIIKNGIIQK